MSNVYQIARLGMQQMQERIDIVSENAAHATVPGYRRQLATSAGISFEQVLAGEQTSTTPSMTQPSGITRHVDLRAAKATPTGRPLDAALLDDRAFFALADSQQTLLTRLGNFRVDAAGWLVGSHDLRVQGERGDIFVGAEAASLTEDGRVIVGARTVDRLRLVSPENPHALQADGRGLLRSDNTTLDSATSNLRVAHLEDSNTDSTREMLTAMGAVRQYESLVRVVQSYDDMLGRTIQKLGEQI